MHGDYISDFEQTFSEGRNKYNFALVRKYLEDKNEIEILLQELIMEYGNLVRKTDLDLLDYLLDLERTLQSHPPEDQITLHVMMNKPFACYSGLYTVQQVQQRILPDIRRKFQAMQEADSVNGAIYDRLKNNLQIVSRDKWQVEYMINDLLEPEMRQQNFRMMVSFGFMVLIGTLLVIFFFVVYRKSGKSAYIMLLGASGLQFVTIFVLIISIIIFGILGVLGGTELAAILSGISGYVLGKNMKGEKKTEMSGEEE